MDMLQLCKFFPRNYDVSPSCRFSHATAHMTFHFCPSSSSFGIWDKLDFRWGGGGFGFLGGGFLHLNMTVPLWESALLELSLPLSVWLAPLGTDSLECLSTVFWDGPSVVWAFSDFWDDPSAGWLFSDFWDGPSSNGDEYWIFEPVGADIPSTIPFSNLLNGFGNVLDLGVDVHTTPDSLFPIWCPTTIDASSIFTPSFNISPSRGRHHGNSTIKRNFRSNRSHMTW